jgi:methanogenic corrinoid protein MtbC1
VDDRLREELSLAEGPTRDDVMVLSRLLRMDDLEAARDFVCDFARRGVDREKIVLDLLAVAAVEVGDCWLDDRCSFCDVTLVLARLQCITRALFAELPSAHPRAHERRRVLLVPTSGEQHTLGLVLLEEMLRVAGWEVLGEPSDVALQVLRTTHVEALGLTACRVERLEALTAYIHQARVVSKNRDLVVVVGGRCFDLAPELAVTVGADCTAESPTEAARLMRELVIARERAKVGC